jgi:hypothetical protein
VIFQALLVSLIKYLIEMNGRTVFLDFEVKSGKCQLNICWISMTTLHRLKVVHEDVQIKLFCFSLEGIALDWCQSFLMQVLVL